MTLSESKEIDKGVHHEVSEDTSVDETHLTILDHRPEGSY